MNVIEEFEGVKEYFSPRIISEVNGQLIKLAKIKGEEVPWHSHKEEDELFLVKKGSLLMEVEGMSSFTMKENDMFVVPKGVEHRVSSEEECWIMLIESKSTKHTGEVESAITKSFDQQQY